MCVYIPRTISWVGLCTSVSHCAFVYTLTDSPGGCHGNHRPWTEVLTAVGGLATYLFFFFFPSYKVHDLN